MAGNKDRITIPGRFRLWLAPLDADAPAGPVADMPVGWRDVGFTTQDGSSFATGFEQLTVNSHQSDYPTRKGITSRTGRVTVALQEWSGENFQAVQGGGTITEVAAVVGPPAVPLHYKYEPPAGNNESLQACLELIDGTKHYRYVVPQGSIGEGPETPLSKTAESTLPFAFDVEGQDGVPPWYLITDDPAFAPVP